MSLNKLPATITTTSALSVNPYSNQTQTNKVKPLITSTIKNPILFHKSTNPPKQTRKQEEKEDHHHHQIINRRNVLLGLGSLFSTAATCTNQDQMISIAAPEKHSHDNHIRSSQTPPSISEFGSQPLVLEKKTVRFLVRRPQKIRTKSKKTKSSSVEVLIVDGIEIHHNGPVKFDVYVAKAHDDVVGPDLGEFAGSLVNLPFSRAGKLGEEVQGKGSLELGISGLVRDIEAEDCEKVAVSLVPRLGEILIRGLRIETCKNLARDVNEIGILTPFAPHGTLAPFAPHRTATFA